MPSRELLFLRKQGHGSQLPCLFSAVRRFSKDDEYPLSAEGEREGERKGESERERERVGYTRACVAVNDWFKPIFRPKLHSKCKPSLKKDEAKTRS